MRCWALVLCPWSAMPTQRSALNIDTQPTGIHRQARRRAVSLTAACLTAALLALFVGAGLLAVKVQTAYELGAQRREIAVRVRELQSMQSLLQDAESAAQGSLLGRQGNLAPYEDAVRELPGMLDRAIAASQQDPSLLAQIGQIQKLAQSKLAHVAETIRLQKAGRADLALARLRTGEGQQTTEDLRYQMARVMESLAARGTTVDAKGTAAINAIKQLAWGTGLTLALAIALAALQMLSLMRMRSGYELQAEAQASMLKSVVDEIPASLAILDHNLRFRIVNKVFERWRQQPRETVIGKSVAEVMGADEFERSRDWYERALRGESVSYEKSYADRPISAITASYNPIFRSDGTVVGLIALAHDTSAHRRERERLQRLSERDPLTGLLNRSAFEAWMADASTQVGAEEIALLYVDLDYFKPVNDQYGHSAGDAVLCEIAERLKCIVRPSDIIARLGGDEFALGLTGVKNIGDAHYIASKVVAEARRPILLDNIVVRIGASVGVAADASAARGGGKALIARADEMLYGAKKAGRDRVQMHLATG